MRDRLLIIILLGQTLTFALGLVQRLCGLVWSGAILRLEILTGIKLLKSQAGFFCNGRMPTTIKKTESVPLINAKTKET